MEDRGWQIGWTEPLRSSSIKDPASSIQNPHPIQMSKNNLSAIAFLSALALAMAEATADPSAFASWRWRVYTRRFGPPVALAQADRPVGIENSMFFLQCKHFLSGMLVRLAS